MAGELQYQARSPELRQHLTQENPTPLTCENVWLHLLRDTPLWYPAMKRTVVVSPHPDDETLGAGGLIALQRERNLPVSIISVSDGEAAYPGFNGLAPIRRAEQLAAVQELGVTSDNLIRFSLPDSDISRFEVELTSMIGNHIDRDTLLIAPWPSDPHPDHEVCGRASTKAARDNGANIVFYFFWAWHRLAAQTLSTLPLHRLDISRKLQLMRAKALACHRSQLQRDHGAPILPEVFLAPARRSFETFIV